MENYSFSVYKGSEEFIKNRNLIFSMDYDSGYISHNQESNSDYSTENSENTEHLSDSLSSKPIYLSEDALLETPKICKYPNLSEQIDKEDFEETRNIFNSPILSVSTTHISGSTGSGRSEILFSGFDTEDSNVSIEIPIAKPIIVDNISVQNTKNAVYNMTESPDLQDLKREPFKNVFNNITNTLPTPDPKKKLTLIFSKIDKENVYTVKRKFQSLTPPEKASDADASSFVSSPKKGEESSFMSQETSDLSSIIDEEFPDSEENECLKCVKCNADISKEENVNVTSENVTSKSNNLNESSVYDDKSDAKESEIDEKSSNLIRSALFGATDDVFRGFKNEEKVDVNRLLHIQRSLINGTQNDIVPVSENCATDDMQTCTELHEDSLSMIKSVVSETLQDVLDKLIQAEVQNHFSKNEEILTSNSLPPRISSTPEKSYTKPIDTSLSPDLFTEDLIEEKLPEVVQPTTSTPKEKNVVKKDYMILRRTQNNLKGVLPPRSLTMLKISIYEMLNKIECNKKYFWNDSAQSKEDKDSKSLLITSSLERCKHEGFPEVLKDRCLGLYHNRGKFSEEFEDLCVKYGQRYVGAETQSSCTVFETNTASPTKRRSIKPQWNAKSPGKRLSHLARRRITFSSANLQSGSSFLAGSRARQILVDAKKMDLLSRRKSPRKSPRKTPKKTPRKSPRIKTRTPSSSAKKKLAMRFRKVTGEIEKSATSTSFDASSMSAKRTLFHSPEEKLNRFLPSTSGTSALDNETKKSASKRALFMSPSKSSPLKNMGFKRSPVKRLDFGMEKKRKRTDFDDELPSKFARCHSEIVSTASDVKLLAARTRSEFNVSQNRQIKELTTNHKKKLQLAIYEALRSQNVLPTHPQFKTFASNLGRLTRKLFLMTSADSVGVTEKMLRIARYHVIAVVKGKAPEEIYDEFMKQKVKNLKPQGYVAPEEPHPEERRSSNMGKPSFGENKIERIRKAINFGDDNR